MRRYAAYLFDLDGVLFRGNTPIPDAVKAVNALHGHAKIAYITNNSALHRDDVAARLRIMGYPADVGQVYTSGYVTARHMAEVGCTSAYVIGEQGLLRELADQGIRACDPPADAVVIGRDTGFTFDKLVIAQKAILAGARFLASNRDGSYPVEEGLEPGAGALVAAVEACVGKSPTVFGKPHPVIALLALNELGVSGRDALMVGDRVDTDIVCAHRAGMSAALVLTGVTASAEGLCGDEAPDYVLETMTELL